MNAMANPPFASLLPVVELLESTGNLAVDGGFLNSPAGWYCRMRDPLDLALIVARLDVPSSWELSEPADTVLDRNTWCAILGPGAAGYG